MAYTEEDELYSQSEYSPSIVKNEEELLRVVFNPEHILNNQVIETAISLDDLKSRGFSIDRKKYADGAIIHKRIEDQIARMPEERKSGVIAKFSCGKIRTLTDGSERAFIIIDTGLKENIAHASIYSARKRGKGALRKLRSLLLPFLQKRYLLEEIFS